MQGMYDMLWRPSMLVAICRPLPCKAIQHGGRSIDEHTVEVREAPCSYAMHPGETMGNTAKQDPGLSPLPLWQRPGLLFLMLCKEAAVQEEALQELSVGMHVRRKAASRAAQPPYVFSVLCALAAKAGERPLWRTSVANDG